MVQGGPRKYKSGKTREKSKRRQKSKNLKSDRNAKLGRLFESKTMVDLLEKMVESSKILNFTYHKPNSPEDRDGRDFTVRQKKGDEIIERSFGVTISRNSQQRSRLKHPHVPQFFFPLEIKPETIQKHILQLFED